MKKFLTSLCCVAMLVVSCAMLFACGETPPAAKFSSNQDLTTVADKNITTLFNRVYNNSTDLGSSTTFTLQSLNAKIEERKTNLEKQGNAELAKTKTSLSESDYYCLVGSTENIADITTISFGEQSFNKDDNFSVSIGKNNFIKDKAFLFKDNKLYVASPIIAFETTSESKIKINGVEYQIKLNPASQTRSFEQTEIKGSSKGSKAEINNNKIEVTVKDGTTLLCLGFDSLEKTDKAVAKKYINGTLDSYGLTAMEDNGKLGLYMTNYKTNPNEINKTKYGNANWDYKAYIIGKNVVATAKIHSVLQLEN